MRKLDLYFRIGAVSCIGLLISFGLYFIFLRQANTTFQEKFKITSEQRIMAVEEEFKFKFGLVHSLKAFYDSSDHVTREEFHTFTNRLLKDQQGIKAYGWVPYVTDKQRMPQAEEEFRQKGFEDFMFKGKNNLAETIRAQKRAYYFPIYYVEPLIPNKHLLGFDLASIPALAEPLHDSWEKHMLTVSGKMDFGSQQSWRNSIFVFEPIYLKGVSLKTKQEREQNLLGFVFAILSPEDIIENAMKYLEQEGIDTYVFDASAKQSDNLFYKHTVKLAPKDSNERHVQRADLLSELYYSRRSTMGGRLWKFVCKPTAQYFQFNRTNWPIVVMISGILITALLTRVVYDDGTYLMHVEEEVKKRTAELQNALAIKDEFVSIVSHELRTPLAVSIEALSLVLRGKLGQVEKKQKEVLDVANSNIDRLALLINDILDVSKIEAGKMELHEQDIDIIKVIRENLSGWQLQANAKKIDLQLETLAKTLMFNVDKIRFMQILSNLVSNAIKFTGEGGKITIAVNELDKMLEFSVKDTGVGIASEDIPKLFQKFQQLRRHPGPHLQGTGLGLSIVKSLVQLHGGEVRVKSELEKGSIFTFTIPK